MMRPSLNRREQARAPERLSMENVKYIVRCAAESTGSEIKFICWRDEENTAERNAARQ